MTSLKKRRPPLPTKGQERGNFLGGFVFFYWVFLKINSVAPDNCIALRWSRETLRLLIGSSSEQRDTACCSLSSKVAFLNRDLADVYQASQDMCYRVPRRSLRPSYFRKELDSRLPKPTKRLYTAPAAFTTAPGTVTVTDNNKNGFAGPRSVEGLAFLVFVGPALLVLDCFQIPLAKVVPPALQSILQRVEEAARELGLVVVFLKDTLLVSLYGNGHWSEFGRARFDGVS